MFLGNLPEGTRILRSYVSKTSVLQEIIASGLLFVSSVFFVGGGVNKIIWISGEEDGILLQRSNHEALGLCK